MAHDLQHDTPVDSFRLPAGTWTSVRNVLAATALVGWAACLAGYLQNQDQFARSYLVAFLATIFMALGGMLFVMIQHLTNSVWSVTVRRLMESLMMSLPVGAVLFIPIALNTHSLTSGFTRKWPVILVRQKHPICPSTPSFYAPSFTS